MAVGTWLTLTPSNRIISRVPTFPWPENRQEQLLTGGSRKVFVRRPYYHYPLYQPFVPDEYLERPTQNE